MESRPNRDVRRKRHRLRWKIDRAAKSDSAAIGFKLPTKRTALDL